MVVADHFAADAQLDQLMGLACLEEHAMQIAAMHHRIGIAEPGAKRLAQIDMGDFVAAQRIHEAKLVDIDSHAARGLADAEIIESVKRVWPKLDAGADLAERAALFQQDRANALLRQPKRRREAADAAAGYQHGP